MNLPSLKMQVKISEPEVLIIEKSLGGLSLSGLPIYSIHKLKLFPKSYGSEFSYFEETISFTKVLYFSIILILVIFLFSVLSLFGKIIVSLPIIPVKAHKDS